MLLFREREFGFVGVLNLLRVFQLLVQLLVLGIFLGDDGCVVRVDVADFGVELGLGIVLEVFER